MASADERGRTSDEVLHVLVRRVALSRLVCAPAMPVTGRREEAKRRTASGLLVGASVRSRRNALPSPLGWARETSCTRPRTQRHLARKFGADHNSLLL